MIEIDFDYSSERHAQNLLTLKTEFGEENFTLNLAAKLGIDATEFAIMCADGVIEAAWCPRGVFSIRKEFI